MQYEIRAMSLGEILDTGFRLLRDHFLLFTGIGLLVYLPLALLGAIAGFFLKPTPSDMGPLFIASGALVLLWLLLWPLPTAAITYAIGEVYLGRTASFGAAMRASLGLFFPLLGTMLLYVLAIAGGFIALVIPGIYLALAFMLINQVIILERVSGTAALRRSRELMRGSIGRGWTVAAVAGLLSGVLSAGVQITLRMVPDLAPIGTAVVQAITFAYTSAVMVVLYFEIRSRKEDFDLEHLARLVESQPSQVAAPAR